MNVLATSAALIPAIIGAVAAIIAAVLSAATALRAQSRRDLLNSIEDLFQRYSDQGMDEFKTEIRQILEARTRGLYISEIVKRGIREVFREEAGERARRRWWRRG